MSDFLKDTYSLAVNQLSGLTFFKVPVLNILLFIVLTVLFLIVVSILKGVILKRLEKLAAKTSTELDNTVVQVFRDIKFLFIIILSLYLSTKLINVGETATGVIRTLFIIFMMYEVVLIAQNIGVYLLNRNWQINNPNNGEEENKTAVNGMILLMRVLLWGVGILIVLTNLGVKISALVASLGISSIAVAFALQSLLADVFSSFSIYFDRPFKVDDFVVIGDDRGIVKKIGIKTTRIQTLQGEELVISNHELTSTRIHNYKEMQKRRVVFNIGVVYETSPEHLRKIPEIIKDVIMAQDNAEFERAHFFAFGDFSLDFEIVYYVNTNDYQVYMDIQQSINLGIFEQFNVEEIAFAYPTQVLYMNKL